MTILNGYNGYQSNNVTYIPVNAKELLLDFFNRVWTKITDSTVVNTRKNIKPPYERGFKTNLRNCKQRISELVSANKRYSIQAKCYTRTFRFFYDILTHEISAHKNRDLNISEIMLLIHVRKPLGYSIDICRRDLFDGVDISISNNPCNEISIKTPHTESQFHSSELHIFIVPNDEIIVGCRISHTLINWRETISEMCEALKGTFLKYSNHQVESLLLLEIKREILALP